MQLHRVNDVCIDHTIHLQRQDNAMQRIHCRDKIIQCMRPQGIFAYKESLYALIQCMFLHTRNLCLNMTRQAPIPMAHKASMRPSLIRLFLACIKNMHVPLALAHVTMHVIKQGMRPSLRRLHLCHMHAPYPMLHMLRTYSTSATLTHL